MISSESDLTHTHPGELEPYLVLDVNDVRMEGVAGDQLTEQRAAHIAASREHILYKSQLPEAYEEQKQTLNVTQALKAMKLDSDQTLPQFLKKELGLKALSKKEYGLRKR